MADIPVSAGLAVRDPQACLGHGAAGDRPGTIARRHWPFQSGYFASSNAAAPAIVISSAAASAMTPIGLVRALPSSKRPVATVAG